MINIDLGYYTNTDLLITATAHEAAYPGGGNNLLITGLAWATGNYKHNIFPVLQACMSEKKFPLIFRSPHKKNPDDHQTADDYWGILPMDELFAAMILVYAESHDWDFDIQGNQNPKFRFDRFPAFAPYLRMCAGKSLSLWDHVILIGAGIASSYSISDADSNKKSFCILKRGAQYSFALSLVFKFWKKRVKAKYGKIGMSWAESMPGHPLNQYDEE